MIDKKPLFIQIKEYYEHLIDIGAFNEGDEMPSVRVVALEHNANPNTVQRAFSLMVESGYLISIPKKGFYVHIKSKDNRNIFMNYRRYYVICPKTLLYGLVSVRKVV